MKRGQKSRGNYLKKGGKSKAEFKIFWVNIAIIIPYIVVFALIGRIHEERPECVHFHSKERLSGLIILIVRE
jgi:hypothetical protein